jgi:hypothetical protein
MDESPTESPTERCSRQDSITFATAASSTAIRKGLNGGPAMVWNISLASGAWLVPALGRLAGYIAGSLIAEITRSTHLTITGHVKWPSASVLASSSDSTNCGYASKMPSAKERAAGSPVGWLASLRCLNDTDWLLIVRWWIESREIGISEVSRHICILPAM